MKTWRLYLVALAVVIGLACFALAGCATKPTPTVPVVKESFTTESVNMMPVATVATHPIGTNSHARWTNAVPIAYADRYLVREPYSGSNVWVVPDLLTWDLMRSTNQGQSWQLFRTNYDGSEVLTNAGWYRVKGRWP